MVLSLKKLNSMLRGKKLLINKIFSMKGYCVFIELISIETGLLIMLYIPSSYDISISSQFKDIEYEIKYYEESEDNDEDLIDKYTVKDEMNIDKMYDTIKINTQNGNFEDIMKDSYNDKIILKNIKLENKRRVKSMTRQIDRLRNMFKIIDYKLCIFYKSYFSSISRDGESIDSYSISKYVGLENFTMVVSFNLEMLLEDLKIVDDVKEIYNQVYNVLRRNVDNNFAKFRELSMKVSNSSMNFSENDSIIDRNETELKNILNEKIIIEKNINKLKKQDYTNVNTDIMNSKKIEKETKKIKVLNTRFSDLLQEILELKTIKDNHVLKNDQVFFDNSVMLNHIIENLNSV